MPQPFAAEHQPGKADVHQMDEGNFPRRNLRMP